MSQNVTVKAGWNVIHVQVAAGLSADELFDGWPVSSVSIYDPAAFLDNRQYSASENSEGVGRNVMRTWFRGDPGASGLFVVPADSILEFKATNSWAGTIRGVPCAPRITWHATSAESPKNYVGLSTYADTTLPGYFSGSGVMPSGCSLLYGSEDAPSMSIVYNTQKLANGTALAADCSKVSNWSGVLYVTPREGVDFGTEGAKAAVAVRNDGAEARTVSARLAGGEGVPPGMMMREVGGKWTALAQNAPRMRRLEPGETWALELAVDRTRLSETVGERYGALLDLRDDDGGSMMRVTIPVTATSDGGLSSEHAWPKGVWLVSAELDTATFVFAKEDDHLAESDGDLPAGGRMKVRLPLYVDSNGRITLLQRFWYGRDTNGVLRAYSGAFTTADRPLTEIRRVSSACLPADRPEMPFSATNWWYETVWTTNAVEREDKDLGLVTNQVVEAVPVPHFESLNTFGERARVDFTVGADSRVNPMRHALHPQHDGLAADYSAPAPSGDDLANYAGAIKPETFSITNRITFVWDEQDGAAWNPAETLSGDLTWEFGGVRREGPVRAKGRFSMKRLSPVTMKLKCN